MEEKNFNFCVCRGEVYIIAKHLQVVFVEEKHTHTHTQKQQLQNVLVNTEQKNLNASVHGANCAKQLHDHVDTMEEKKKEEKRRFECFWCKLCAKHSVVSVGGKKFNMCWK